MKPVCLLILFLVGSFGPALAQEVPVILKERVDGKETPGIVVGIFENGKTIYYSLGVADLETKKPVGQKTFFEIGSITKTFTNVALAEMAEEGQVSLNDPVKKYLPENVTVPSRNGKEITLLDLATAHSGLPRMPRNFNPADPQNPYIDYTEKLMLEFISGYSLTRDIGGEYEYSNLGMGLLGVVLTKVDKKPYRQVIETRILKPLGMNSTFINTPDRKDVNVATGYSGNMQAKAWTWTDDSAIQGAGGIRSNAEDMMKYLLANLNAGNDKLGKAMRQSHQARADAGRPTMKIGLGWHIRNDIVWHNGGTGGFRTFAGFDPKKKMAVVVLTNSNTGADDIGFHLMDATIPLKKIRVPQEVSASILSQYPGYYEITPTFGIEVTVDKGQIFVQASGQSRFEVYGESETKFYLTSVDAEVEFFKNDKGQIEKLVLYQNGNARDGKKIR